MSSDKERFLILPPRGISGRAMQAAIFQHKAGHGPAQVLKGRFSHFALTETDGSVAALQAQTPEFANAAAEGFEVISQRFDDGPAIVEMTPEARLMLEASNPGLRVFPITDYDLPVPGLGGHPEGAHAAGAMANVDAVEPNGAVFAADLKQRLLANDDPGAGGEGVLIGVIDSGIDNTHPALEGAVVALRSMVPGSDPASGGPVDWGVDLLAGHGTHVAGIIAAQPGFDGPAGVAPNARLISYRVFPDNPAGRAPAQNPAIVNAVRAAIEDGCHLINLSIEGREMKEDGVRSALAEAWENGVVCISVAGNGFGNPVNYPGAFQHCVAVTAIGRDGDFPRGQGHERFVSNQRATTDPTVFLASFSNFGPQVKFTAPGHAIVSTHLAGGWRFSSGTSMAAPFVSGMLARVLSNNYNILNTLGNAERSAAMLQALIGRARRLGLPQLSHEGFGLPV